MVQSPSDRLLPYWRRESTIHATDGEREAARPREWSEWLAKCMGEHPAMTLGAAAAVGLALGWMVKRK
jgi:ElaB/YqjD/DUF883 family membrane-anchored ribosome-binding protein